jgi:hypothetical protein
MNVIDNNSKRIITGGKLENLSYTLGGRYIVRYVNTDEIKGGTEREDNEYEYELENVDEYLDDHNYEDEYIDTPMSNQFDDIDSYEFPYNARIDEIVDVNEDLYRNTVNIMTKGYGSTVKDTVYGGYNKKHVTTTYNKHISRSHSNTIQHDDTFDRLIEEASTLGIINNKNSSKKVRTNKVHGGVVLPDFIELLPSVENPEKVYPMQNKIDIPKITKSVELVDNRIEKFVTELDIIRELDKKYLPFDKNSHKYKHKQFIKNIILTLLRESMATHLINDIFTEEKYHCPRRLYYWINNTWLPDLISNITKKDPNFDTKKIEVLPMFPEYKPSIAFYDEGLFEVIHDIKQICINIEKYYSVVYEYMFKYQQLAE